jgi:transcriptional regulator with XRE-family HTH domain
MVPKHLTKQEFGKRLYRLMLAKGWNQSELGRQSGLPRDSVSTYVRGRSLPTPQNLMALSEALGVSQEELLPNHTESAIDEDTPSFEMKTSTSSPNMAWVRVNRLVTMQTAIRIADLLENDRVLDRSGSGSSSEV